MATIILTTMKIGVGMVSGSVGVLSEGIHSFLDLISAAVAFFTVQAAVKPADHDHPFGHGKFETLSSLLESLLLVGAAGFIIYEGVEHIQHPEPLRHAWLSIATIVVSLVASWLIYRHNLKAAREAESSAIHVNALHFLADVVASAGVLAGLLVIQVTGWEIVDPIMAFGVAIYIFAISIKQIQGAVGELVDVKLPQEEIRAIEAVLEPFKKQAIEIHDLRTRRSGAVRHIDFHLVFCGFATVDESHRICDEMESAILRLFHRASVNIHVEPCERERTQCHVSCAQFPRKESP